MNFKLKLPLKLSFVPEIAIVIEIAPKIICLTAKKKLLLLQFNFYTQNEA